MIAISLKILQNFGNFSEYTQLQVKQAVTGNGKATKEQVSFMVKRLLGIKKEIKPLDITDAIAIALTHSQRIKGQKFMKKIGILAYRQKYYEKQKEKKLEEEKNGNN